MNTLGDGIDRGLTTGEQFGHFVYWAVNEHPPGSLSDDEVQAILRKEFPDRDDPSKWPDRRRRVFQPIPTQRGYARLTPWKLGIRNEADAPKIAARIGRKMAELRGDFQMSSQLPEEVLEEEKFYEGSVVSILVNRYERDPKARRRCLEEYGYRCVGCEKLFEDVYGEAAQCLIHVHHLKELSTLGPDYEIDPIEDLRPICPNCHAVVHAHGRPAMAISKLRRMLAKERKRHAK